MTVAYKIFSIKEGKRKRETDRHSHTKIPGRETRVKIIRTVQCKDKIEGNDVEFLQGVRKCRKERLSHTPAGNGIKKRLDRVCKPRTCEINMRDGVKRSTRMRT